MTKPLNRIFWIGRHIERIAVIANHLKVYSAFLIDERRQGMPDWFSLLIEPEAQAQYKPDPNTIENFLLFDRNNPFSVFQLISLIKMNAESIQSRFPTIAFESINRFYLWFQSKSAHQAFETNPDDFLEAMISDGLRFSGAIENNMIRNADFYYYRLGKMLESAIQTAKVLYFSFEQQSNEQVEKTNPLYWLYVLKFCASSELFLSGMETVPNEKDLGIFLLFFKTAPKSILFSLREALIALNYLLSHRPIKKREQVHEQLIKLVAYLEDFSLEQKQTANYKKEAMRVLNKVFDIADKIDSGLLKDNTIHIRQAANQQ